MILLAVAAACGQSLPHPPYAPQATNALARVEFPPPPGRIELIPPRPSQADAWVDGEWVPRHGRWYWLLGRWVKAPPGATYSPWVIVRTIDGDVYYAQGVWKGRNGDPIAAPAALAFATADADAVFDAEGEMERTGGSIKTPPPTGHDESPVEPRATFAPDSGAQP
jgi:hypothetical protein